MPDALAEEAAPPLAELRNAVDARFAALRSAVRRRLAIAGLAWFAGAVLAALVLSLLLDWTLRPEPVARRWWGLALLAGVAAVAWRKLLRPLFAPLDAPRLAAAVRRHSPAAAERVAAVLELPSALAEGGHFSPALVRIAVADSAAALAGEDFRRHLDGERHRRRWLAAAGCAATMAALAFEFPRAAGIWRRRWIEGSAVRWPQRNVLALEGLDPDGVLRVPREEPFPLRVGTAPEFARAGDDWRLVGTDRIFAYPPGQPPRPAPPPYVRLTVSAEGMPTGRALLTKATDTLFAGELPPLRGPARIWLDGGDDRVGPTAVEPVDRPVFRSFTATAVPPGQTQPATVDAFSGQLLYLRDAAATFRAEADQPLAGIDAKVDAGAAPGWTRVGPAAFEARIAVRETQTWEVTLRPQAHAFASRPARIVVTLLQDRPPRVELAAKGVGRRVTPKARIPLAYRAEDDLALAAAAFETETSVPAGEKPKVAKARTALPLPVAAKLRRFDHAEEFKLAALALPPGAIFAVRGSAEDACAQGKQRGESRQLAFQIVTPEELFYEILTRQRAERGRFEAAHQKMTAEAAALDAAKAPDAAKSALRLVDVTDREVWRMAGRIEASLVEMRLNELGTPATLDLMENTIVQPMKALHDAGMPALAGRLRAASADAKALPDARKAQHDAVDEMKRILDRMSQWEGFVDVVNQLKAIKRMETGVLERTEKQRPADPAKPRPGAADPFDK